MIMGSEWVQMANWIYAPFVATMLYWGMDEEAVIGLSILIVIDMITGVWKTIALDKKPSSTRFVNGLISKLVLLIIPFVLAVASKSVHLDLSIFLWVVINALILSEMYSILANIYTIRSKKETEEFDVMSIILRKTRKFIDKVLGDV